VLADLKRLKNRWFFKSQEVCVKGIPDIILCLNGFFIAIELKACAKSRIDELQRYNAKVIHDRGGGLALIVWPEIWEKTLETLKKIDGWKDPRLPNKIKKS
jgi:hypothetical protein